jgi:hypothetical protein
MAVKISQGRVIPDTDAERVAYELDRFTRSVGPEILRALTDAIQRRKSGQLRMFLNLKRGSMESCNVVPDLAVDLDGASG